MEPYGSERQWYWIGAAALALGAFAMIARSRGKSRDEEPHYVYHLLVCLTAAVFYTFMGLDQLRVEIPEQSRHVYLARYIDWSITTPLLLLGLCTTALGELRRRAALVVGILVADVAIMGTGLAAALSHVPGSKITWYLVSCAFQLAVYVLIWGPLRREATSQRSPTVGAVFTRNATVLSVLWLLYPLVWLGAPEGFRLFEAPAEALIFLVLDIVAKVGYGFMTLTGSAQLEPHAAHYRPVDETSRSVQSSPATGRGSREPANARPARPVRGSTTGDTRR